MEILKAVLVIVLGLLGIFSIWWFTMEDVHKDAFRKYYGDKQ